MHYEQNNQQPTYAPYGQQPQANPYATQPPYGQQPQTNPYATQPPYGQQPQANPYATQPPYGQQPQSYPYGQTYNSYGQPQYNLYGQPPYIAEPQPSFAPSLLSFIFGIVSFFFVMMALLDSDAEPAFVFAILFAVPSAITGIIGMVKSAKGQFTKGIIFAAIGLFLAVMGLFIPLFNL